MASNLKALLAKSRAEAHNSSEPKHKVKQETLEKVAERAHDAWQAQPFPGASAEPWITARINKFLAALEAEEVGEDADLFPAKHPVVKAALAANKLPDPWAELVGAEERLAALAKSAVTQVTRASVRKQDDASLFATNQRLSHLYKLSFKDLTVQKSASGLERAQVIEAAALVHEEMERRGHDLSSGATNDLYAAADAFRSRPTAKLQKGELLQGENAVGLVLGTSRLDMPLRSTVEDVAKAASYFGAEGSRFHEAFLEPAEVSYVSAPDMLGGSQISALEWCACAKSETFTEVYVTSEKLNGPLVIGKDSLMLRSSLVPYVLTKGAVEAGWMPPAGESALPPSLEQDVPPELRYWKPAAGEPAGVIRKQLVESGLFGEDSVALVDGLPRRTFVKHFVAEPFPPAPSVFAQVQEEESGMEAVRKATGATLSIGAGCSHAELARVSEPDPHVFQQEDTAENRVELAKYGRPFLYEGELFVSSHPVRGLDVQYIDTLPEEKPAAPAELAKRSFKVLKSDTVAEERFVLGVVLEPETVDSQKDIYSDVEIRKSAHTFMATYQHAGLQHSLLIDDHVDIVESYLAPVDFEIGEQSVKKGTWLMGMKVRNDDIWALVKEGGLTGFSIGGEAIKTEEPD